MIEYIYKFFEYLILTNVKEVKSVDLFFNQFETQETGESDAKANPRVLIEILPLESIKGFGGNQTFTGEVKFYIGIDIINTFNGNVNTKYLSLLDTIYANMNFKSSYQLPDSLFDNTYKIYQIERNFVTFATNDGVIKVTEMTFSFILEDDKLLRKDIISKVNDNIINLEIW